MNVLVTGAAGFIGSHVCQRLLQRGDAVVGLDNLNDYYDVSLKQARLSRLLSQHRFQFVQGDVADRAGLESVFASVQPTSVVHLAAQAGVRYSILNPAAYVDSNLVGFANILEGCRHGGVSHLLYASSSSVYGGSRELPFSERHTVDCPVSFYAATKKANELMAHSYSHLFGLPTSGLRFFTVYGPWGRPDMALFLFTKAIKAGEPIDVFNGGAMTRDFTFIDDAVEAIIRVLDLPPVTGGSTDDPATGLLSSGPYRILNVGNGAPTSLLTYIEAIEAALGKKAIQRLAPLQPGDVPSTSADNSRLEALTGFRPQTPVAHGVRQFVQWFEQHYDGR